MSKLKPLDHLGNTLTVGDVVILPYESILEKGIVEDVHYGSYLDVHYGSYLSVRTKEKVSARNSKDVISITSLQRLNPELFV